MFKHILLPIDGSALSSKAANAALAMAKELGAKVTGYCALDCYGDRYMLDPKMVRACEKRMGEVSAKYLSQMKKRADKAGVSFTSVMSDAKPYRGIVDTAKKRKCDVIVMGSHGRGSLSGLVLGSVTQKVLAHTKVPVLVHR